jgi:hypothetical protein
MNRRQALKLTVALPVAPALATAAIAADMQQRSSTPVREAVLNFDAAQAALYSALAYAGSLERLSGLAHSEDMDIARAFVHTINREIQGANDSSVKIGQAEHEMEKVEGMKQLRSELFEATKAVHEAQSAVDGVGSLGPPAKNIVGHLMNAAIAMYRLGAAVGAQKTQPPGMDAYVDFAKRG